MQLLFLGAGASNPFGIPTMPEFIGRFDDEFGSSSLYSKVKRGLGGTADLEGIMTVLGDLSKPEEELLNTISPHTFRVIRHLDEDPVGDQSVQKESADLLSKCKQTIRKECLAAVAQRRNEIVSAYDDLFSTLSKNHGNKKSGDGYLDVPSGIWIFTTNYDTCLEEWGRVREVELDRGLKLQQNDTVFDASFYSQPDRLYKLHGSIDMFNTGGRIRRLEAGVTIEGNLTFAGEEYGQEYLFYPIENSGYDHVLTATYLRMMLEFREGLEGAERVVLIGSSLRDRTIASTLDNVLSTKRKASRPSIQLLDPNADQVIARLDAQGFASLAETMTALVQAFPDVDGIV